MTAEIEIFPIGIGQYDHHPNLDVDTQIDRLAAILAEFGAEIARPWHTPMSGRGRDAVDARLNEWSDTAGGPTILYWVGHGWSDNRTAALAHARSEKLSIGLAPVDLAKPIAAWEAHCDPEESWLLVVIDACQSAVFAELLAAEIDKLKGRRRIVVVGTAGRGSTALGRFTDSLDVTLRHTFAANTEIAVTQLTDELDRTISDGARRILNTHDDAVLRRKVPTLGYSGPLDLRATLTAVLKELSEDERRHFVSKAQGGELRADQDSLGEVAWYFTGRERERRTILGWLANNNGMLVVTGRAGSGKSALLGDILVRSRPQLAQVLLAHQLLDPVAIDPPTPFDCALHLTGLAFSDVIARISEDLQLTAPDPQLPFTAQLDHLHKAVRALSTPPRLIVDALDEAVDPLRVAAILRRVGDVRGIRLVVGTRRSTVERPDQPDTDDTGLLDALATPEPPIVIERDPDAITRYITRRLTQAKFRRDSISRAARSIAEAGQEFLYARLAAHELLARPELLSVAAPVVELLGPDHRSIFAAAVDRLAQRNPAYRPLLLGLALAQGRGAPIRSGVWTAIASAATETSVTDEAAAVLLDDAAPYVVLDSDHGQTVYRLAHRTFTEQLTTDEDVARQQHEQITRWAIGELTMPDPNEYWVRYTSAHAAGGGLAAWQELDASPSTLDHLDPGAVARDAMRSLFGFAAVPPHIGGVISAAHELGTADRANRTGMRQLATAYYAGTFKAADRSDTKATWTLHWAALQRRQLHATLTGHTGGVEAVAAVPLPDGRTLLATGGADATVRLWDPTSGAAVGDPLTGHTNRVRAVAAVPLPDGRTLLATAGSFDGTVWLWDPICGTASGYRLRGHIGAAWAMTVVPLPDGRTLLATAGSADGRVRLLDPTSGAAVGELRASHYSRVEAMAAVPLPDGRSLLATAGKHQSVRLWDPTSGAMVGNSLIGHAGWVQAVAAVPLPDGRTLLATGGGDATVRLWDPTNGSAVGDPLIGHTDSVRAVAAVPLPDGRTLLATVSGDQSVRLWDPIRAAVVGGPLTVHPGAVDAMTAVPLPDGRTLLATASRYGYYGDVSVRLWDPVSGATVGEPLTVRTRAPDATAAVSLPDGRTLLATASRHGYDDVSVRLRDPVSGATVGEPLTVRTRAPDATAAVSLPDGRTLLATASRHGYDDVSVRLRDPDNGACTLQLSLNSPAHSICCLRSGRIAVGLNAGVVVIDIHETGEVGLG